MQLHESCYHLTSVVVFVARVWIHRSGFEGLSQIVQGPPRNHHKLPISTHWSRYLTNLRKDDHRSSFIMHNFVALHDVKHCSKSRAPSLTIEADWPEAFLIQGMYQSFQPLSLYTNGMLATLEYSPATGLFIQSVGPSNLSNTCDHWAERENQTIVNLSFHTSYQPPGMPFTIRRLGISKHNSLLCIYYPASCVDVCFVPA